MPRIASGSQSVKIALRPSGGRGEYELTGRFGSVAASDLFGLEILFDCTPEIEVSGRSRAERRHGKPRVRLDNTQSKHAYLLLAAVLLLPKPKRELRATGTTGILVRRDGYSVTSIDVEVVRSGGGSVNLRPKTIWLANAAGVIERIHFAERMATVRLLWEAALESSDPVAPLVIAHEAAVTKSGGDHKSILKAAAEMQAYFETDQDLLPLALARLGESAEELSPGALAHPLSAEEGKAEAKEDDDTESSEAAVREVAKWRMQLARGAAARKFSTAVRDAYNHRCVFSGLRLPKTTSTARSGVEAAHILPYARYGINTVNNGLCLDRLCHWAFDSGVLRLDFAAESSSYLLSVPDNTREAATTEGLDLDYFLFLQGVIPEDRLPASSSKWPDPDKLVQLNRQIYGE